MNVVNAFKDLVLVNAKFVTAFVVGAVVFGLQQLGFVPNQDFVNALGVVITALLVWLVPNKPASK